MASLNDKYRAGDAFYFTDQNGQHYTTDLAGRNLVNGDWKEEEAQRFSDADGHEWRVPAWEVENFVKNNIAEGRVVKPMERWTLPGNSRGGKDDVYLSAFDKVRKGEMKGQGWVPATQADASIVDTIFGGGLADEDIWRAPENRGPEGEGNVAKDVAYHAENVGRGVAGAVVAGATGVAKTIGDLVTAGGAFAADALGLNAAASELRATKRAIDEKAGKVLDWTTDNVLGDAFFNEGDGTREMAKAGLKASEEIGGLYGLGKVISGAPINLKLKNLEISEKIPGAADLIQGVAGAMGKTVDATKAATGAMAGLMGAQGYEDTISAKEATGKEVTWRDQVAGAINGGVAAAIAPLYGKVAGLVGKEEATRVIQKSYGDMLKRATAEVAGGAGLGFVQGVGTEAANAVQDGQIREGAAKRVLTAAAVGGALVGATKVPGALGGWVRENRVNYARAATMQGESALAATRAGMPLERSRFTTDDVRAVTQNNEVVFQDGTVYIPARFNATGKRISDPKIVINDGTILSPAGKVIGVRGTKLGYMNEIRGEAATPAEAVYRQTDPEAPFKFRIVDPTTGESIENGALAGLEAPEGVRAWFEAKRAGTELPELDADGHAYTALWLQAHSVNPEISRAAQLGLEQVAAGKMDYRSAAEVVDNAIEQTKGWQYSIYGQFKRGGAVKPEAAAGTEAEQAAGPVKTDLPALGNAAEAPRADGAVPKATTANAELLLGYVTNGTIAPTEVPAAKILPAGETPTVAGAATRGPVIVRQNADGSYTTVTGGDKIEEAKQSGAKAIKTVVVKEEDGWTDQATEALALVDALKNGEATPAETVKAVAKLGLSEEDLRGITAAVPDAETVTKMARQLAPAAMDKLDDGNISTIASLAATVNVKTYGMDWETVQTKLVETMPEDVDADVANLAGMIAMNDPTMDGVRAWDLAEWANVHAGDPAVNDALLKGEEGVKALEEMMAKDSAGTVPVEQPDGELKTVNEIEAEAPKPAAEVPRTELTLAPTVDKSLELVAVPGKDGVFHCALFPTVEMKFENGTQYVTGLTPQLMLDSRNRYEMGKLLTEVATKAEEGGYTVAFEDDALVEIANELVQNYRDESRERAMTARAKSAGKVLIKSGLANEIVVDKDRFEQELANYPEGVRLAKDGKTYGFFSPRDGKVYLNGSYQGTRIFLNTTIHEFTHPAFISLREVNPTMYNRMMELVEYTDYYTDVKGHEDYSGKSEQHIREEACVRLLSERLEDIKAKVPAKIYKEIEEFVTAFWKRFGEANGIADLTPAMVQTMTIEDMADAVGAEMLSGRKFGTKPLDAQAGILKGKLDRYNSSKITSGEHKKAWYEIRTDWKALTEEQKAALETWARDDKPLADLFTQLRRYDAWRAEVSAAVKQRLKKAPTPAQENLIRSSREWYLANGTNEGATPFAWLVDGHALHIPTKHEEGYDWFANFFDGMPKEQKTAWKKLLGGKNYAAGKGTAIDLAIRSWNHWRRAAGQLDDVAELDSMRPEEFLDALVQGENAYQEWKAKGKVSAEEAEREYWNDREAEAAMLEDDYNPLLDEAPADDMFSKMSDEELSSYLSRAQPRPAGTLRLSRGGVYTGSSANYDKPSLFKIGTGEGSQVYGWGLYGSTVREVAETYKQSRPKIDISKVNPPKKGTVERIAYDELLRNDGDIIDTTNNLREKSDVFINEYGDFAKGKMYREASTIYSENVYNKNKGFIYEQTFFTNRADGDESHLLSWYEPEPEKLDKDIPKIFEEYGYIVKRQKKDDGWQLFKPGEDTPYLGWKDKGKSRFGDVSVEAAYKLLISALTPEQASRGLARHGWDGIKYPVDSYGAKAIKDGNVSGWNYVSFRDDNIRVDHKWRDGEMMFNRGPNAARAVFVAGRARAAEPGEQGEQTPGTLAASRELANQAPTPLSMAGQIHRLALPISEMEWLRKKLTGNVTPAHVGRPAGGGIAAASKSGKVVIEADVFGTVDKTDMAKAKQLLVAHGFFRNEDPIWCAAQAPATIAAERGRSEDQLATQLLNLAKRRNTGLEAGGQGAARGAFAAEVAKIVMDMPDVPASTTIGRVKTIGQGVRDFVTAGIQYGGGTAASAEASMRHEAGQFLDWCYGGPVVVDPATGATDSRGNVMTLNDLTTEMFGKFLIMPQELERQAPEWSRAIENAIATNPKLADAWQELSIRGLTTQAHAHVAAQIAASQSKDHERALAQLDAERREPIKAGGFLTDLKEQVIVGMHDTMGPVYIRINEAKKRQIAAKKKLMRTLTPAQRAVVQADIDRFIGQIATDMNKFELARTAWERGAWNEGRRYNIRIVMALNNMTERDGNTLADLSEYDNMQHVIETQGKAGSYGINPRQAQLILGDMARRLGPEKWTKLETTDREIHAIMEQEIINDFRFAETFGQGFADYCRTQVHYVTTKRVMSPEELDAVEQARAQMRRLGIAGGDDVISQMYAYGGKMGAAADVGEANWTAKLKGSMAASQEVLSSTFVKQPAVMNFCRRNHFVIEMRQALLDAGVKGVRDMKRVDGSAYPENKRYGHINYLDHGQKRVLVVPRQIADGMRMQPNTANLITTVNGLCRSAYIDYNVAYWNQNINRNNGSIEKNMPGMSEPWLQTIGRAALPGVNKIGMLAIEHAIRNMPENVSLPLRLMLGKHTPYYYIPQGIRYTDLVTDPSAWQQKLWAAEDAGDIATVTEMQDDFAGVMEMLRANMFVPSHHAYTAGQTKGFLEDVFDKNGLKLIQTKMEEDNARSRFGKAVKAVNIFKKNQAQQEREDVLAKVKAYLHDRMMFGAERTVAETGNVVKKNVSIAEGERAGSQKGWIQQFWTQFFNMCEKGNVRHFKAYAERPGETLVKVARTWVGRLIGGLLTSGIIAKIMLDDDEVKGDPKKAAAKYGAAWDYAKFMQRSAQNISKYTKTNAEYQPIWTSEDGYTSIVLAAPLNDEDKIVTPTADATVQSIAYAMGIGPAPKWGDAIVNSTIKAVTPDLQAATPIWNLGKTVIASMTDWNPMDQFRQAPMFDKDLHANKFRSLEDAEEFGLAAGMRLWNDFGGRAVIQAPVNGVDNGRGSAPEALENVLKKIPVLSPAIGRFVKIQVGSPAKRGEAVAEDREKNAGAVRLCAKRLLGMSEAGIHQTDPKAYEDKIAEWTTTYGLNPFEVRNLRRLYLNAWIQRANRGAYDDREMQKLRVEARKQGMDDDDIWLMLGE